MKPAINVGAQYKGNGDCDFTVWAPLLKKVTLQVVSPKEITVDLLPAESGYWKTAVSGVYPGTQYLYGLNGLLQRPDPASHSQPDGVHGPSEIIDHADFPWNDTDWHALPLKKMILYELHVGTFTQEGTFEAVSGKISHLKTLGVTAVEIMPVAQFPGKRNWGYDGTYPFAAQNSYGGPLGFKRLIDALHTHGLAVILDAVYNHFGPEGNYLEDFCPFFTDRYKTPWGKAINFDGAYSDGVRDFFIQNALHWFEHYHVDGLRLDAIDQIYDMGARHFLRELKDAVSEFSRRRKKECYLIAESDLNDVAVIHSEKENGYGIDAQWSDDFHHSLHALLTGEKIRHYVDFGRLGQLEKALQEGFVYSGEYSLFRKKRHGNSSLEIPAEKFVIFSQNHDQVGNRPLGERLTGLVPFECLKLAAGILLTSPYVPLLFMGEEYGEDSPFLYFTSHSDERLIKAIRKNRNKEALSSFTEKTPPDPQSEDAFIKSILQWDNHTRGHHKILLDFYCRLIRLRKEMHALSDTDKFHFESVRMDEKMLLFFRRWCLYGEVFCVASFNKEPCAADILFPEGRWEKMLDSSEPQWQGCGPAMPSAVDGPGRVTIPPFSFTLYGREKITRIETEK